MITLLYIEKSEIAWGQMMMHKLVPRSKIPVLKEARSALTAQSGVGIRILRYCQKLQTPLFFRVSFLPGTRKNRF